MEKRINYKKLALVSVILAILVFTSGILIGVTFDEFRTDDISKYLSENELQTESYLIEKQFLEGFGKNKCVSAQPRIQQLSSQLGEIGRTLARYESKKLLSKSTYEQLKKRYFIFEIKLYVLLKELNDSCSDKDNIVVLYFYDTDHQESLEQGYVLDALVKRNNLTVFSIDRRFTDDPLFETVINHYNITKSPTLIVNFNKKIEGYTSIESLSQIMKVNNKR